MRVIAGSAKGRKLQVPQGLTTRPTPARVRESLFSMVAAYLPGAQVLDLFAGTGALGIESLSRGAQEAVFVEVDRRALTALRQNIALFADQATVLAMSAVQAMRHLAGRHRRFDVIFLDPPYALQLLEPTLVAIACAHLLADHGVIICEHHGQQPAPEPHAALQLLRTRRFGDVALSLLSATKKDSPP